MHHESCMVLDKNFIYLKCALSHSFPPVGSLRNGGTSEACSMLCADKGTQKKQDIKITGASTLAGDEVDRMVKDAEQFADEDKKRREAVDVKNQVCHPPSSLKTPLPRLRTLWWNLQWREDAQESLQSISCDCVCGRSACRSCSCPCTDFGPKDKRCHAPAGMPLMGLQPAGREQHGVEGP